MGILTPLSKHIMHKFIYGFAVVALSLLATSSIQAQLPTPAAGKVERIEAFQSKYVDARNVDVWLPDGYSPKKRYAVLYMHDGQMLYDSTVTWNKQEWMVDEVVSKLMREGKIRDAIVVGVWNNDKLRHSEYYPQKPAELLNEQTKAELMPLINGKLQSDAYLKFLVTELKPYIDSHYATLPDQQNTFVAGSSMGGLISMYAICEYPEVFGGAACLSTHWVGSFRTNHDNPIPDTFVKYLQQELPSPKNHKIYFDYGTATLDSLYKPSQLRVDAVMRSKGYTRKSWITREFPGEDHSERAWQRRLNIPLEFLLQK